MKVDRLFLNGNQKNELNREIPISWDTTLQRLYPLGVVMFERALGGMPQQPSDVSIEEFRGRQERVLSRLSHTDILIIASPGRKRDLMTYITHLGHRVTCCIYVAGKTLNQS